MGTADARSAAEIILELNQALDRLGGDSTEQRAVLANAIYNPHPDLASAIQSMNEYLKKEDPTKEEQKDAGKLMERIVKIAFQGLKGYDRLLSYTSPTAQHDLLITGKENWWHTACGFMRIDRTRRGILVEAKATGGKVGDPQFARLCAIIKFDFENSISLGVFFTIEGASGFPEGSIRQQKLGDARLRQVVFHAKCNVPIIVFDWDEIKQLVKPGSLPTIIEAKIADIEHLTGLKPNDYSIAHVDLPKHLR